jgi:hypothetical protein
MDIQKIIRRCRIGTKVYDAEICAQRKCKIKMDLRKILCDDGAESEGHLVAKFVTSGVEASDFIMRESVSQLATFATDQKRFDGFFYISKF